MKYIKPDLEITEKDFRPTVTWELAYECLLAEHRLGCDGFFISCGGDLFFNTEDDWL